MKHHIILLTIVFCFLFTDVFQAVAEEGASDRYLNQFEEIVNIVEKHFYNPEQIVREFPEIKARYQNEVAAVSSLQGFSLLVNRMLGELDASHTYFLTPDDYEYYQLGALFSKIPEIGSLFKGQEVRYPTVGILTQTIKNKVYIVSVLPGSMAEKAGMLKGDEILSVNGHPYSPIAALRPYVGKEVVFEIRRKERNKPVMFSMEPVLVNPKQEFLDAQKKSVRIIERDGIRIGYIHIYSYAGDEYHKALLDALVWGTLKNADALIIDLRYGLGGAWPYYLNIFNRNIPSLVMYDRDGDESVVDSQWRKPAVYLVNGFSRSGKELLAFGAKKYHLATVIGERTAGQTLGGRLFPLSGDNALFLAVQSCRIDGMNLEGVGVSPDVEVLFDIRYCAGQDAQLEKALEYLAGGRRGGKKAP